MLFLKQSGSVLKEYFSLHSYFLRFSHSLFLFGLLYRRYVQVINLICLHLVFRFKICDLRFKICDMIQDNITVINKPKVIFFRRDE